ncbi:MAG: cbb3-type cytochrome c oxidase N-terminal domain-containing protein [Planctomycetota bacterium]
MTTLTTEPTRGHSYDGIAEFDSRLPNWWLWSFYLACIFAVLYWVHFHTLGTGDLPIEAYLAEQRVAAAKLEAQLAANPITDAMLLQMAANPTFVEEGRRIFQDVTKCALCHKPDGGGLVGPNLTDDLWIYGGKPMDIFTTISKGRAQDLAKGYQGGMLPFEGNGLQFVLRATAYVLAIKNTNVKGKEPEPNARKEQ